MHAQMERIKRIAVFLSREEHMSIHTFMTNMKATNHLNNMMVQLNVSRRSCDHRWGMKRRRRQHAVMYKKKSRRIPKDEIIRAPAVLFWTLILLGCLVATSSGFTSSHISRTVIRSHTISSSGAFTEGGVLHHVRLSPRGRIHDRTNNIRRQHRRSADDRIKRHKPLGTGCSHNLSSLTLLTSFLDEEDVHEHMDIPSSSSSTSQSQSKRERYFTRPLQKAIQKFKSKPGTYLLIPCIAAVVGWFTNWLAVQMIFYPIQFRGLPIRRWPEVPLGLIGWQGIVPCKTRTMSIAMVDMVTSQLLSIQQVFGRLNPNTIATLLAPKVPTIAEEIVRDVLPTSNSFFLTLPRAVVQGLPSSTQQILAKMNHNFLKDFTIAMQQQIESLLNVQNCVVDQMLQDRTMLGTLFRKCGQKELDFLTNSGLWFGFFLGVIQMIVALFWDNPWSLSIGGGIVGLATNWLALKFIFEPVNPTKFGPFVLQGLFLTRQKEVAKEFSAFFATRILTSEKMFRSILTDPSTSSNFQILFATHFTKFASAIAAGLGLGADQMGLVEPETIAMAAERAVAKLPDHIHVLHDYVDENLGLRETLRISMEGMTSAQFERVLHPIFEEDELTLILAGAALGFAAGLVQQGLETGKIKFNLHLKGWKVMKRMVSHLKDVLSLKWLRNRIDKVRNRTKKIS